jgi:hypothetical protein
MTKSTPSPSTRVSSLIYRIAPSGNLQFQKGISVKLECPLKEFNAVIEPPSAKFTPTRNFPSVKEAREVLDPQLETWRVWVHLTERGDLLPFEFQEATQEAVDVPPGSGYLIAGSSSVQCVGQVVSLVVARDAVPTPPQSFVVDDLVRVGLQLYVDAEALPRHSLKIAYAYVTIVELEHGDQASVARNLGFSNPVLAEFKELSSRGGSHLEARKFDRKTAHRIELTDQRRSWLLMVFRELILRQGQFSARGQMPLEFSELCPGPRVDFPNTPPRP